MRLWKRARSDASSQPSTNVRKQKPRTAEDAGIRPPSGFSFNRLAVHSGPSLLVVDRVEPSSLDHQADATHADAKAVSGVELTHPVLAADDRNRTTERAWITLVLTLNCLLLPPIVVSRHGSSVADASASSNVVGVRPLHAVRQPDRELAEERFHR